jgi:hypothetical protein
VFFVGISGCSSGGTHPWEDLVKSGYKPEIKSTNL